MKRRLGFEGCFTINSLGRRGGLALLWKNESKVEIESFSQRHISAKVTDPMINSQWLFTRVYWESETGKHHITWDLIQALKPNDNTPWLVTGDFNKILYSLEKFEGRPRSEKQIQDF